MTLIYEFDDAGRLESIARAASAEHRPGGWLMHNVRRSWFDARSVTQTDVMEERWDSKLDDTALAASVTQPSYLPASALRSGIQYRRRNGLDASEFEENYWGRWFYPFNVLALCLAAMPFAFGSLRSGGVGKRLFIGGRNPKLLVMMDADTGKVVWQSAEKGVSFTSVCFSPDGKRLAVGVVDGGNANVWVYEWERDILTRVTADPAGDVAPVWTPDGTRLVFASTRVKRSTTCKASL